MSTKLLVLEPYKKKPKIDLVKILEDLLEQAKTGELQYFAGVGLFQDQTLQKIILVDSDYQDRSYIDFIGGLETLKARLVNRHLSGYGEDNE